MSTMNDSPEYAGPITELAVRRLAPGQDVAEFATVRDRFVGLLRQQSGVRTDREFAAFLDFATFATPEPDIYVGMTQYDDMASFAAAGEVLGSRPEAGAFFATFTPLVFTALRPLDPEDRYDLSSISAAPGQVLEVAQRDLSAYADVADYDAKRRAFLDALKEQDGVVGEYQWVSAIQPGIAVGMTVYSSAEAFQAVATSAFAASAAATEFLTAYPPVIGVATLAVR